MEFVILVWSSKNVLKESIFGVVDKAAKEGMLPSIHADGGVWERYRTIPEDRFQFALEARASIEARGYFLIGGATNIIEIENSQHT